MGRGGVNIGGLTITASRRLRRRPASEIGAYRGGRARSIAPRGLMRTERRNVTSYGCMSVARRASKARGWAKSGRSHDMAELARLGGRRGSHLGITGLGNK